MKRFLVISIALSLLTVCVGTGWAAPVEITFWHIYGPGSPQGDLIDQAVAEFNAAHAGEIVVSADVRDFWTFLDQLNVAIAGGVPPDLVSSDLVTAVGRAHAGQIINLLPYLERDGVGTAPFWPSAIETATYQGGVYALPFDVDTRNFYWNRSHFAESGLDPNSPPKTWDDIEQVASVLTRWGNTDELERVGFHPIWGNAWFLPWAWTNGGRFFDADGRPTINDPRNVEALEWVVDWIQLYGKNYLDEFATKFTQGEPFTVELLSTVVETSGYAERILRNNPDLDFGVTMIPINREEASWGAGFDLEMVRTPRGNYDETWAFIRQLVSEEFMYAWVLQTKGLGALPSAAVRAFPDDPNWIASVNQMLTTRHTPYSFEVPDWWQITFNNHINPAFNLEVNPANALAQAQDEVLGRYLEAIR